MNDIVRMRPPGPPTPPSGELGWFWDGERWVCGPCSDFDGPRPPWPPGPPPFFPPPQGQPPWYPGANGGVSFGTTAPPNPIRGHFWFDGVNLHMFDGASWIPIGGGTAGGGTPPSTNPPANPQPGQQWFDGTTLWIWDGNAWVPVAGTHTFVQATAPPAPVPGDLWFDGTQMRIWDGTAWELVGPGATVGPVPTTTEVFRITQVQTATYPGGQWDITPIDGVPIVDLYNGWNVNTKQYKPNRPGYYACQIEGNSPSTTYTGHALLRNDSGGPYAALLNVDSIIVGATTAQEWFSNFGIAYLNGTTDFVRYWIYGGNGSWPQTFGYPVLRIWLLP